MWKNILVFICFFIYGSFQYSYSLDTAGSMLHINPTYFNHPNLIQLTWTAEIYEYDYIPAGSNPFKLRIEFNSVGFMGNGSENPYCYVGAMIQNVGHQFEDDIVGSQFTNPPTIISFPAIGLYLTSLQADWPDSYHGVELAVDPNVSPRFGRVFEDVDAMGHIAKNIYTRENVAYLIINYPIKIKWTVTKGETVVNPEGNYSKNINGDWVPLIGTFVKWNFKIEINNKLYNVADYYLPIEKSEYIWAWDPLVLHQEYFGAADGILNAQKGKVRYMDMMAYDGTNWYYLEDWKITWRIPDTGGVNDSRFGWCADSNSLYSRVGHEEDLTECYRDVGNMFHIDIPVKKDDLLGTWDGQGVYYRNSDTGAWVKMASPASQIAAGDVDGDGIDDLIGIWPLQGGVWIKYSSTGNWVRLATTSDWISAGDMNGDGRDDLLGTWDSQGVYYRNSDDGTWAKIATHADLIAAGDLDGDGTDDLIGIWSGQGGVWVKYSSTSSWSKLSSTASNIASGDMNGDGRDDLLGTWDGQGVYYRNSDTGAWVKMASPADLIAAGDLDGDGTDDLIGIWSGQGGVWVKYSSTGSWSKLSSAARDIAAGKMKGWGGSGGTADFIKLLEPIGGYAEGPGEMAKFEDLSNEGLGGWNFVFQTEKNLVPHEKESIKMMRIPGPGEPGFKFIKQKNLVPQERLSEKKRK